MAIKDLAVAYNGSSNAGTALACAVRMCRKYRATLTGVYVHLPLGVGREVARWATQDILDGIRRTDQQAAGRIQAKFHESLHDLGFDGPVEWVVEQGTVNESLSRFARYHDLLLMGQYSEPDDRPAQVRAEDLVMRAGRPVLIVPIDYRPRDFSEYAVVAWDGSRPAARALTDAMQILETKTRLDVVTVIRGGEGEQAPRPGRDVIRHLQRHGVDARRVWLPASRGGVGRAILDYCRQHQPDLLVMGAYGHARLREDLFGGVTRQVLDSMCVPGMMSH